MADCSRRQGSQKISAVFFDLDNTVIQTRIGDRIACFKVQNILINKYGFTAEAAINVTQNFLKSFRRCPENIEYPLHDWRHLLWKKCLGEKNSEISGEIYCQWLAFRYKYIAPSLEMVSLLESLKNTYFLAVITNGPSKSQWEKIKRLRLTQYFDLILVSGDLKWEKPNKNIFLEACTHLGVSPSECLMVGDKLETDILGGIKAGLGGTIWLPLSKHNISRGNLIVPDWVVNDVADLKFLLSTKIPLNDFKTGEIGQSLIKEDVVEENEDKNANGR